MKKEYINLKNGELEKAQDILKEVDKSGRKSLKNLYG